MNRSFLLEYPPIYKEERVIELTQVINIAYNQNEEERILSIYHELSHFLSSGEWVYDKSKKMVKHISLYM